MKVKVDELKDNKVKVAVSFTKDEVDTAISKKYAELASKYKFPGFRAGKAPRPVVDNMFTKEGVLAQVTDDIVNDNYPLSIDDANIFPAGQADFGKDKAKLIVKEMMDLLCLELVDKKLIIPSVTLHIGYSNKLDVEPAHGTCAFDFKTNSASEIIPKVVKLYERIVDEDLPVRRMFIYCNNTVPNTEEKQLNFFEIPKEKAIKEENDLQKTLVDIKQKFGKNSVIKGMDLEEAATTMERNGQIGGHSSGEEN